MIRVQHDDADKPFTLTSYKINNTPITLTQGETGDYSTFLTGPNVPDPTDGYDVEIVLELDSVEYTYTLNVTYASQPTPTAVDPAFYKITGNGISEISAQEGVTSYTGSKDSFTGEGYINLYTVTGESSISSVKIDDVSVELTESYPDGEGRTIYAYGYPEGTSTADDVVIEFITLDKYDNEATYTVTYS